MRIKNVLLVLAALGVSFFVALKAMDYLAPRSEIAKPALAQLPPLPAAPGVSSIIAPITVPFTVIRDAAERRAPKSFAGKADNPIPQLLQNPDINWTVTRGAIAASGAQEQLNLSTPINGGLTVQGTLSGNAQEALGSALGSLLGGNVAKQLGSINIKNVNARADIRGTVTATARPVLTANWRIDPNIGAQVALGDTSLSISGVRVNVPNQIQPMIDQAVSEQLAQVRQAIIEDASLENALRTEWAKLCRSIPLTGAPGFENLFVELRPTRAVAAQPRMQANAMNLTLGLEAQTRITSSATKPDCPFPANLAIVPQATPKVQIALPIDMPFTQINKIIQTQFAGKTFPEDGSGAVDVTVKTASVAASGDQLLISLLVNAKEKKSFFGVGGEATVHIWGKPVLDKQQQILRMTDLKLAVESEAAFGLLGVAARAAIPLLQDTLTEKAVVDLKPIAADARKQIAATLADMQMSQNGVRVEPTLTQLTLGGIAFDSNTLRVIAEAEGAVKVSVTALP